MTDTPKTRVQLIQRAAKLLGAIEAGEAPSAEDYATLDGNVDPLVAQLEAENIYYVSDIDDIELSIFEPLARLLANNSGPDFGSPINEQAKTRDEQTLRRLSAATATQEVLKATYF